MLVNDLVLCDLIWTAARRSRYLPSSYSITVKPFTTHVHDSATHAQTTPLSSPSSGAGVRSHVRLPATSSDPSSFERVRAEVGQGTLGFFFESCLFTVTNAGTKPF